MSEAHVGRLRKSDAEIRAAIERLDDSSTAGDRANQRQSQRFSYRVRQLKLEVPAPSGGWIAYQAPTRNISREGIGVLTPTFLYPGCECRVHLVSLHNRTHMIKGRVARCRYIAGTGSMYEVGITFEEPIDVEHFHRGASTLRLLIADDDGFVRKLVEQLLKPRRLEATHVGDGRAAIEAAQGGDYDVILMDINMPELDGVAATCELRKAGYTGPIIAITAQSGDDVRKECVRAGFTLFLSKPFDRESLTSAILATQDAPLVSSMLHDREMVELIDEFVATLPDRAKRLTQAMGEGQIEAVRAVATELRGVAGGVGFSPISVAAHDLEAALRDEKPEEEIREGVAQLSRMCLAARPASFHAA